MLWLGGCVDADLDALQAHLDALRSRPQGQISPLPAMPDYRIAHYHQRDQRSPFMADQVLPEATPEPSPPPDAGRPRQPLESFELDRLALVGTLALGGVTSGLVAAPDGRVRRIGVGDHLGRDRGRVVSVGRRALTLVETVPDGEGGWRERTQRLSMTSQDAGDANPGSVGE
nr:pilus assembly protein PilP [Salinicola sp. S1-1-2]